MENCPSLEDAINTALLGSSLDNVVLPSDYWAPGSLMNLELFGRYPPPINNVGSISEDLHVIRPLDSEQVGHFMPSTNPLIFADESLHNEQWHQSAVTPNASADIANPWQLNANPLDSSANIRTLECYATRHDFEMILEGSHNSEKSSDGGNSSKRDKATLENGTKSCNCKSTRCMKKYCQCFASNQYCSKDCSCEGCHNIKDFEDTVYKDQETRDQQASTPNVERRRGCNCKKSLCHKKYCECFGAGIECCVSCRCENCKNPYGVRHEYSPGVVNAMRRIEFDSASERINSGNAEITCRLLDTDLQGSITPRSQIIVNHSSSPRSGSVTVTRRSLEGEFNQAGRDNYSNRYLPDDNSEQHLDENISVAQPANARNILSVQVDFIQSGYVQSDARNHHSLPPNLIQSGQPLSNNGDEDLHTSNPNMCGHRLFQ